MVGSLQSWAVGLTVSLFFGNFFVWLFLKLLRRDSKKSPDYKLVPAWITGITERLFFTVAVAFSQPATTVAMMAWIAAKMAAHWNSTDAEDIELKRISALLAGIVSMLFAMLGGLICNGSIDFGYGT